MFDVRMTTKVRTMDRWVSNSAVHPIFYMTSEINMHNLHGRRLSRPCITYTSISLVQSLLITALFLLRKHLSQSYFFPLRKRIIIAVKNDYRGDYENKLSEENNTSECLNVSQMFWCICETCPDCKMYDLSFISRHLTS